MEQQQVTPAPWEAAFTPRRSRALVLPHALLLALLLSAPASADPAHPITDLQSWQSVTDKVVGGSSEASGVFVDGVLTFSGATPEERDQSFAGIHSPWRPLLVGGYDGLVLRLRGDARRYTITLQTADAGLWIVYQADIPAKPGKWVEVYLPFSAWIPTSLGQECDGPPLDPAEICSIGFLVQDGETGSFHLEVDSVATYRATDRRQAAVPASPLTVFASVTALERVQRRLAGRPPRSTR